MLTSRDILKLLYSILAGDATLQGILGGTLLNPRIYAQPLPEAQDFPFATLEVVGETRNAFLCDQYGDDTAQYLINVHIWDERERRETIDSAQERILTLLNETLPADADVEFRSILKDSETMVYEKETRTHHMITAYRIIAVGL